MWAMHRGFVNPELIGWHRSAEALLMILIGGLGTLHGPDRRRARLHRPDRAAAAHGGMEAVRGHLQCDRAAESRRFLQPLAERKLLLEGVVILLVVLCLPKGLSGIALPRWLRRYVGGVSAPAGVATAPTAEARPNG
jgi:branched-chain amino acid transport system permease protein